MVPIWEKYMLTVDEAVQYFGIGEKKIRMLISEEIAIRKDVIKKDVFYETEKASERMEDMHLFIQTAMENRNFFTVGSWNRQILFR